MNTGRTVDVLRAGDASARRKRFGCEEHIVSLSFKVTWEFRQHFKICAAHRGLTMNELLHRSVEALEQKELRERNLSHQNEVHIWK